MGIEELLNAINTLIEIGERVIKLPSNERQYYRNVVRETFDVLNSALVLVINRLGSLLVIPFEDDQQFNELRNLDNFQEWIQIERSVGLCEVLRAAGIPANSGIQDLKNVFDELTNSLKSLMSTRSAMTALPTNYNPILEKITNILEKVGQDIGAFVKLDIRTEVKKGDQITAVYETVYEINGNITTCTQRRDTDTALPARVL
jgi:hypothetical protein